FGGETFPDEGAGSTYIRYPNGSFVRCEDEPIHIPGAIQSFGCIFALDRETLAVRQCSLNVARFTGLSPARLFLTNSLTDILKKEDGALLADTVRELSDVEIEGAPVTFVLNFPAGNCWVAAHIFTKNPGLVILEGELVEDLQLPHHPNVLTTTESLKNATEALPDHSAESQAAMTARPHITYAPMRMTLSLFSPRGTVVSTMETFRLLDEITRRLETAQSISELAYIVVRVVNQLVGFHRTMVYQFDETWNGSVEAEHVDATATSPSRFLGLKFPAGDIPPQARALYQLNR
ncbi:Light-sensor Protein kinase, partial [Gonapodya sp. JEL0774]